MFALCFVEEFELVWRDLCCVLVLPCRSFLLHSLFHGVVADDALFLYPHAL